MCYSKILDVLFQDTGRACCTNQMVGKSCPHRVLLLDTDVIFHKPGRATAYFSVKDVLFLDTGCAISRYRMCFSKIQEVLFQDTGSATPRYRKCYSKISVILVLITQLF
jgi:hypothetical protein